MYFRFRRVMWLSKRSMAMAKIVQMNTYRRKRGGKLKVPRQSRYPFPALYP